MDETSTNLEPPTLLLKAFEVTGLEQLLGGREGVLRSLTQLQVELAQIGLDAMKAEASSLRLSQAVLDFDHFPYLARLHAQMDDILTQSLEPELVAVVRQTMGLSEIPLFDDLRNLLVEGATNHHNPITRNMLRVLLFEGIRLNLMLRMHRFLEETYGRAVTTEDLSEISEETIDAWTKHRAPAEEGLRVYRILTAAALSEMDNRAEELRAALVQVTNTHLEQFERRAAFEAHLSKMDTSDALLIRNYYASELDEQQLTVELLRKRHPYIYADRSRAALDQQMSRIKKAITSGKIHLMHRKKPALLDLINESEEP